MIWPVRGVTFGGPDRFATVYSGINPPGWTVDCNAKFPAPVALSRKRILILAIGESGMVGMGLQSDPLPTSYPPPPSGSLWTYDLTRGWLPLVECVYAPPQATVGASGIFCWKLQQLLGPDYEVGLLPCAVSSTTSIQWSPGTYLYNVAKDTILSALGTTDTVLGGILMEQGINDPVQNVSNWATNWSAIEDQLRLDVGTLAPIYYARQHNTVANYSGITSENWSLLLAEQDSWSSTNRIKVQKPEGPWVDAQVHLATSAQIVLAQRYMDAWIAHPGITS